MGLQRHEFHGHRQPYPVVALLALVAACTPPAAPTAAPEPATAGSGAAVALPEAADEGSAAAAATLTDRFSEPTPRQTELRETAIAALQYGQLDTSITALLALRDTEPMSEVKASGLLLLSELYFQQERIDDSLAVLEALRPASPPQGQLEYLLGRTYHRLSRAMEAEDAWRRAIRLEPDFLRSYVALADVLRSAGRTPDAEEVQLAYERQVQLLSGRVGEGPDEERIAAIEALAQAVPDERVSRAIVPALQSSNPMLKVTAAMALAEVGTASALEPMVAARTTAGDGQVSALIDQAVAQLQQRLSATPRPATAVDTGSGAGSQ